MTLEHAFVACGLAGALLASCAVKFDDAIPFPGDGGQDAPLDGSGDCAPGYTECGSICVDMDSNALHCGSCYNACPANFHAQPVCDEGACALSCDDGWADRDGEPGCECHLDSPDDDCDGLDDNCNGEVDEGYVPAACGLGECVREWTCVDGVESCIPGEAEPETCDGLDNDCDGTEDNGVCDRISAMVKAQPTGDSYERYHYLLLDCPEESTGCTTYACPGGRKCEVAEADVKGSGGVCEFTGLSPGPHRVCYCNSAMPGYTWTAELYIREDGEWSLEATSSEVRAGAWLCVGGVMPW